MLELLEEEDLSNKAYSYHMMSMRITLASPTLLQYHCNTSPPPYTHTQGGTWCWWQKNLGWNYLGEYYVLSRLQKKRRFPLCWCGKVNNSNMDNLSETYSFIYFDVTYFYSSLETSLSETGVGRKDHHPWLGLIRIRPLVIVLVVTLSIAIGSFRASPAHHRGSPWLICHQGPTAGHGSSCSPPTPGGEMVNNRPSASERSTFPLLDMDSML